MNYNSWLNDYARPTIQKNISVLNKDVNGGCEWLLSPPDPDFIMAQMFGTAECVSGVVRYPAWLDNLPFSLLATSYYANGIDYNLLMLGSQKAVFPYDSEEEYEVDSCWLEDNNFLTAASDIYIHLIHLFVDYRRGVKFFEQVADEYANVTDEVIVLRGDKFLTLDATFAAKDINSYDTGEGMSSSVTEGIYLLTGKYLSKISRNFLGMEYRKHEDISFDFFSKALLDNFCDVMVAYRDMLACSACTAQKLRREFMAVTANRKLTGYAPDDMCKNIFSGATKDAIEEITRNRGGRPVVYDKFIDEYRSGIGVTWANAGEYYDYLKEHNPSKLRHNGTMPIKDSFTRGLNRFHKETMTKPEDKTTE